MKEYILKEINQGGYDRFLLCLTFEGIMNYLSSVEASPMITHSAGMLLIDQLLITGNSKNRFISCRFRNGKIDFSTAINVTPDNSLRKISIELLHDNLRYIECSILTELQKQRIIEDIVF